ncbi:MAG TPA: hypothetical protein VN837_18405 [Chloroflexota bacterium]|nr:hypothetical protein [Chloroflexota bacterium]
MKRLLWILVRVAALAIVLPLGATLPTPSAHAAGPGVSSFYPATKADYDAWPSRKYAPPPNTSSFPSGTAIIAFYFAYSGAIAKQTVYVGVVENSKGSVMDTEAGTLTNTSSEQMFWVRRPNKTFPDDVYKVTLTLDGLPVGITTFTVGGSASGSGGNGSGPNPGGNGPAPGGNTVKVSPFYPVSQADFNDWAKLNYPTPARATTFTSGKTWWIPLYFGYSGAVAKTTQYSADLRDSAGKVVATTGPYVLTYAKGRQELYIPTPNKADLPDGTYTAEVLIGGQVAATTTLMIGGAAPATTGVKVSPFYPVSQADFNDWVKLNYPTPAQATTYASGKTWWIPLYFGYSGAVAKTTQFSADLRDSAGKVVGTTGPYALAYAKGRQEVYIPTPNKAVLPDGTYTAEVLIGGQVAATTTLSVGG